MKYTLPTAMLVLAILFTGVTVYNWVQAQAVRASVVSSIAELLGEENIEQCQEIERYVSRQLSRSIDAHRAPIALGVLAVVTSFAALMTEARRKQKA